jgi:hypothetical protein
MIRGYPESRLNDKNRMDTECEGQLTAVERSVIFYNHLIFLFTLKKAVVHFKIQQFLAIFF